MNSAPHLETSDDELGFSTATPATPEDPAEARRLRELILAQFVLEHGFEPFVGIYGTVSWRDPYPNTTVHPLQQVDRSQLEDWNHSLNTGQPLSPGLYFDDSRFAHPINPSHHDAVNAVQDLDTLKSKEAMLALEAAEHNGAQVIAPMSTVWRPASDFTQTIPGGMKIRPPHTN